MIIWTMQRKLFSTQRRNKRPNAWRTAALCALSLLLLGMLVVISINLIVRHAANDRLYSTAQTPPTADCILVLGAGVRADGRPSDMLRDRILQGVALYKAGCAPIIVMSGDSEHPNSYDEVGVMKQYAIDAGVPAEAIVTDPLGLSTADSMKNLADTQDYATVIVISQTYHLYRAVFLAKRYNLDAVGCSADLHTYRLQWYRDLREIAARCKDFLLAK